MGQQHDEAGQVGGIEAIAFGMLILVVGALLVSNAWAVIDAKTAAQEAAREAVRSFVTAPVTDEASADAIATQAAMATLGEMGWTAEGIRVARTAGGFERCDLVTFEVTIPVRAMRLPWLNASITTFHATADATERVDPYRSGVPSPPPGQVLCTSGP